MNQDSPNPQAPSSEPSPRRRLWAWALYDWGNSAFATTVMAGFFPVFFGAYWGAGNAPALTTFRLGLANSVASMVIVLLAPLLGAVADAGRTRKRWLAGLSGLGVLATGALAFIGMGEWALAAMAYVIGCIGFLGANVFYDSLLVAAAPEAEHDRASSLGYALGYLGGGLLFALNVAMAKMPHRFGLPDATAAVKVGFLSVAVWWALFTVPLLRWVPEPEGGRAQGLWSATVEGLAQLRDTLQHVRQLKHTFGFLLAYWLYIDGVDTIVRMAVDFGMSIGLKSGDLIGALLLTQFVGFPAAILFGRLGQRWGTRRSILVGIAVYAGVTLLAANLRSAAGFYALAAIVGLVQGGVQALSRSLFARLSPRSRVTEFFGLYNMLGKFAAVLGPLLMGLVALASGSTRWSITSLLILFALGGLLLSRVDVEAGERAARQFD